ncbi:MAG: hypothetical protein JXB20_06045 [Bacilli bacterium]|nr:hypothetical protein [Bacilli bacterium]MBN2696141.1 hypothetical protein [Bacilli bacterium]
MEYDQKQNDKFVDDGRTIVNMDFEALSTYKHPRKKPVAYYRQRQKELAALDITPKERWAMIKAVYIYLLPFVLVMFGVMALVMFVLTELWKM